MKNIMVLKLLGVFVAGIFVLTSQAERFEYTSEVNRWIPDSDSTGVRDTILVPQHIIIEDFNVFLGIGDPNQPWARQIQNNIFSPSGHPVTLNGWGGELFSWYYFWYDTDRPEDGPGELEDFAGIDAFGNWELCCYDPFDDDSLYWYYWRIELYGELMTTIQEKEPGSLIPQDYILKEVSPNPFNGNAMIEYGLPVESRVKIEVYDILGRVCKTLIDSEMPAGYHQVLWNGEDEYNQAVASGVYLVKMTAGDREITNRSALVK